MSTATFRTDDRVRILRAFPEIARTGDTGRIAEYPCCGEQDFAIVELDSPQGMKCYAFRLDELEVIRARF